jgi:hypothetical protein
MSDLHRGINEYKRSYQPRSNLCKDKNGDLFADLHKILNRWKKCFCQSLNMHNASYVRKTEVNTAEPLVPDPSCLEVKNAIAKL